MREFVELYDKQPSTLVPSHETDEVELGIAVDESDGDIRISKTPLDEVAYVLPTSSRTSDVYPHYVDGLKYYIGRNGETGYDLESKYVAGDEDNEGYRDRLSPVDHPHVRLWLKALKTRAKTISEMFKGTHHLETILPIVNGEPLAQPASKAEPTELQRRLQSHFQEVDAREKKSYDGEKRQCMVCKEMRKPGRLAQSIVGGLKWTTQNAPYTRRGGEDTSDEYPLAVCAECAEKVSAGYDIAVGRAGAGEGSSDLWFTRQLGGEKPLWLMVFNTEDDKNRLNWITQHVDRPRRLLAAIRGAAVGQEVGMPTSSLRIRLFRKPGQNDPRMTVYIDEVVPPDELFGNVERFASRVEEGVSLDRLADATYRVKDDNEDLKGAARSDLVRSLLLGENVPDRWIRMWHQQRLRRSRRGEAGDYWAGTKPLASERSFCALITDEIMTDSTAYKLGQFLASADSVYYNETSKSFYASSRHWREMVEAPEDAISNLGEKLVRQEAGDPFDHLASVDEVPDALTPQQQATMTLGYAAEREEILSSGGDGSEEGSTGGGE